MENFCCPNLVSFSYMAKGNNTSEVNTSYFCQLSTSHIKRTISFFSHYFPSSHMLWLELSLSRVQGWTQDLGLVKKLS